MKSAFTVALSTELRMNGELLDKILESPKTLHPKETINLLRGKANKTLINVSEAVIPPLATYGKGFSALPAYILPDDFPSLEWLTLIQLEFYNPQP